MSQFQHSQHFVASQPQPPQPAIHLGQHPVMHHQHQHHQTAAHDVRAHGPPPPRERRSRTVHPTLVWGVCGLWPRPSGGGQMVVSVPAGCVSPSQGLQAYADGRATAFLPLCNAFAYGTCVHGERCALLHATGKYLLGAVSVARPCCGDHDDAFTKRSLSDTPALGHLALDVIAVPRHAPPELLAAIPGSGSARHLMATRKEGNEEHNQAHHSEARAAKDDATAAMATAESVAAAGVSDGSNESSLRGSPAPAVETETADKQENLAQAHPVHHGEERAPPARPAEGATGVADFQVLGQLRLAQTCITTALQRGEANVCNEHLDAVDGCHKGKDCPRFHVCREAFKGFRALAPDRVLVLRLAALPMAPE